MGDKKQKRENQFTLNPIAAAVSAALVTPATAIAQDEQDESSGAGVLEEVIVTAQKIQQNLQRVPFSVQALPEAMLHEMGAQNTDDYARFVPSMTWRKEGGGGTNQIIFRGVNTGTSDFIATASASMYLDETSVTMMGDQPDIRLLDVARVEALAGPQGTLYGAAAQAGTLRIITNQPDPGRFEANVDAMLRSGSDSDTSYDLNAMVNIPLVEDVFAIRIAALTAEDGGFIDNVPGHTPDAWFGYTSPSDNYYYLGTTRKEWGTLDNAAAVEKNWNSVDHLAVKVAARWDINENWAATLTYNHAENKANASNDYNSFVGDLQTIQFQRNKTDEEWDLWGLTIEADLGFAQFISSTSFFDRVYDFSWDRTLYYKYWQLWACEDRGPGGSSNPAYAWYWADPVTGRAIYYPMYCPMGPPRSGDVTQQADFLGVVEGPSWQDKFAQEFRFSHQGEKFDWLAGLYYEESNDNWDAVWMKAANIDYQDTTSLAFVNARYSDPAWCAANYADPAAVGCGPGTSFPDAEYVFLSADRTEWKQKAVFGEVTWHINDDWHATFGGRWFETKNTKSYLKYHAAHTLPNGRQQGGIIQPSFAPGTTGGTPVSGKISEFVPKLSLAWNIDDEKMLYALYSEGYRTGGVNRANARADWDRTVFPQTFEPDKLANHELGFKSRWADNTVQLNLTAFYMAWEDFQIEVVDPSFGECVDPNDPGPCTGVGETLPWLKVVGNVGDAHTSGLQAELAWIPAAGWDIGANAQWLEAEIDEDLVIDPDSGEVVEKGRRLPNVPEFQGGAWAAYTWPVQFMASGEMYVRGQYSYVGESETLLIPAGLDTADPNFVNHSYSLLDARLGLISSDGSWQIDFFINNITDERAEIYHGSGDHEWAFSRTGEYEHGQRIFTNRPREYGFRFTKRWGG